MSETTEQQVLLLPLPYEEITEVANRATFRAVATRSSFEVYGLDLDMVQLREGFNARVKPTWMPDDQWFKELKIRELMDAYIAGDVIPPIEGDLTADGSTFIITDGYRRFLAHTALKEEGYETFYDKEGVWRVQVVSNPPGTTELSRMKRIITSQENIKLEPMMIARCLLRIKETQLNSEGKPYTNDDLATDFHKSRQWVDNMINLNKLPEDIIIKIEQKEIAPTAALHYLAEEKKADKLAKKKSVKFKDPGDGDDDSEDLKSDKQFTPVTNGAFDGDTHNKFHIDELGQLIDPNAPLVNYDKDSIHKQEEEANKATDPNFKETRPKADREDALGEIDFKKEKVEGEMDLNEAIKMMDKINVMMDSLPAGQKQFREDVQRLCVFSINKIKSAQEILKKAADKR